MLSEMDQMRYRFLRMRALLRKAPMCILSHFLQVFFAIGIKSASAPCLPICVCMLYPSISKSWPLQVRSYSVKFPLSPFKCCQAWYSYSVKFPLSHPLLLGVSLVQLQCKVFFLSCCQPTNRKYHLLESESDWSRLLLSICWLGLRRVGCCCNAFSEWVSKS